MPQNLLELRVRNLGVIDDVTVSLGPGMTALTGETGAGKTLLIQALSLLLGGRADHSVVRAGAEEALVEGRFAIPAGSRRGRDEDDPAGEDGELLLARSVVRGGRSRAWIDGRMASLAALTEAVRDLIELHGQHEHRSLTHTDAQRGALDGFGHVDLAPLESARRHLRQLMADAEAVGGDSRQRAREVDLLRYQLDEIDAVGIEDPGEDDRLGAEEDRLAAAEAYRASAAAALAAVSGSDDASALGRLAEASGAVSGRDGLVPLADRIRSAMGDLTDLAVELRAIVETWEDDPERLESVRGRRHLFRQLERKYGGTLSEVLSFAVGARERLEAIGDDEQRALQLDDEIRSARQALDAVESKVASARRRAAPRLAAEIEGTLRTLAMPSARFSIAVEGGGPADQVTFWLAANPGEPSQPLAKVASGGELARTMMAVRLAVGGSPGVMAFDEVDAGIGGAAATAVGMALAGLGRGAQVLVVTHLAQVAALADHQIEVRKFERGGRTCSDVVPLDTEGRVIEISRMLSGRPDSSSARRHARELLDGVPAAGARA
ncbi:MAG TPA: DNA repair protein RecN [Acidimicrobiales bacterium]|jgi:DNA repair protein RecN (Recombination protein N)|nr:DNA repair protein RecN [Acidimicrobiales bacterium]